MGELRKKSILPIFGLVLVAILVVSLASYAYWQITKKQTDKNIVGSACLDISLSGSNDINLANAWPITDSEGAETTPYTFTITNNCNDEINYQVALESLVAGTGESANYLDYKYLKVQLNDNEAILYKDLTDLTPESGIRATKELAHHTLAGKDSITYNLRLWIDEDTPLQNEDESYNTKRFFYGKVRVIAGPNVLGDIPLKVLSLNGEPEATINNISIGNLIGYGTEQFYVIGIDGNNVKLLSRYILNVGEHPNINATLGLQNAEIGYTRTDVTDIESVVSYGDYNSEEGKYNYYYGAVHFSNDNYWWNFDENNWISPYSASNNFVYNNNASVSEYVNGYVQSLRKMGLSVVDGSLLSVRDIQISCGTSIATIGNYSTSCPKYISETTYWLGTAYSQDNVWAVFANGTISGYGHSTLSKNVGVRPVITITLD